MNTARNRSRISTANPSSVLKTIDAVQGHIVEEENSGEREQLIWDLPLVKTEAKDRYSEVEFIQPSKERNFVPTIKLRINPATATAETVDEVLESCVESAEQIQQLAQRLRHNREELNERESDLDSRIENWEAKVKEQQSSIKLKLQQLEQQDAQVRCQQLHLMQLQTDIIKSHAATKAAIESLVTAVGDDAKTVATLKGLKHQISGRFDYIARRWEHLANIMQVQRDQQTAHGVNDLVDWTGEFQ